VPVLAELREMVSGLDEMLSSLDPALLHPADAVRVLSARASSSCAAPV